MPPYLPTHTHCSCSNGHSMRSVLRWKSRLQPCFHAVCRGTVGQSTSGYHNRIKLTCGNKGCYNPEHMQEVIPKIAVTYRVHCLTCFNCLVCRGSSQGQTRVRCCQDQLQHGEPVLLTDVIDGRVHGPTNCGLYESMGYDSGRLGPAYLKELIRNFV